MLLVVLDAARRDALEPYGAPPGSTPTVAQLARRGSVFGEVYATGCWTVPSHASMFTGLLPRAAGLSRVGTPAGARPALDAQRERLLPEVFRRAGYSTAAASANLWVSRASGFSTGFDDFAEVDSGRNARFHGKGLRARAQWLRESGLARVDDGAADAASWLERWRASERRPFLWFVNLIECHSPYLPPRGYGDVSLLDRLRAALESQRHYNLDAIWRACVGGFDVPAATIERMRRLYMASIAYMDAWLARLLERLDEARLLDDTLVVVTSDHGENFGEGGLLTHALSLDNRLIHVPFVAAGPGIDGRPEINSLADLPRFLAGAAGVDDHPWRDGPPAGVGVAQFDPPVDPGDAQASRAVERWGLGQDALDRLTTPLSCAVAGELKLMRRGGREELYDLRSDPLELAPLEPAAAAAEHGERLAALRAALAHPAMVARRAAEPSRAAPEVPAEEVRRLEERMKLLGYM